MAITSGASISCLVSGSQLFRHEITSPLNILVIALITAMIPITLLLAKKIPRIRKLRRYQAKLIIPIAIIAIALVVFATYNSIRPGLSYGAWLNGTTLHIRFYQDDTVTINICQSNISVTSTDKALDMLSLRTNGLSDPLSGIHMGYYRTKNGHNAYVLILSKSSKEALVIQHKEKYTIIALPCAKKFYEELTSLKTRLCSK